MLFDVVEASQAAITSGFNFLGFKAVWRCP